MSRAFVKEQDGEEVRDDQLELRESPYPNHVTPKGLALLRQELAELTAEKGRLDPADLEAKLALAQIDRRMRYVTHRIDNAIVIDPAGQPKDEVAFGATVRVADEEGAKHDYAIVGEDEADAAQGKVSWVSPLARALTGAKVGQFVTWKRPAGDTELEVLAIKYEK